MKILAISRSEWADTNSIGNTFSNFFGDIPVEKIASLYFRNAPPNNRICKKYFSLTEFSAFRRGGTIFSNVKEDAPQGSVGGRVEGPRFRTAIVNGIRACEGYLLRRFRGSSSYLPYLIQDLYWRGGWWKSQDFKKFLREYSPTVIFFPSFGAPYTHRVARYVARFCNARLVIYHADDYILQTHEKSFSLKALYFSILRAEIKKTVGAADLNYAISQPLVTAYTGIFDKKFELLNKGVHFDEAAFLTVEHFKKKALLLREAGVIKCLYIGSLEYGRWKTMQLLVNSLRGCAFKELKFEIEIYSQYRPKEEIINAITVEGISKFMGTLDADKVPVALKAADLVLHVESFDEVDIQSTRYSFSTKIVDCLASMTPVLAIGPADIASMSYLIERELAVCVTDRKQIDATLHQLCDSLDEAMLMGRRAYAFALENHDIRVVRAKISKELAALE